MTKRQARAEQTRTRILDAAEECFAEEGFERTRLEDVAKKVGVQRGAIFHYFAGKQELYEAVLTRLGETLMQRLLDTGVGRGPLPERIEAALVTWIDFAGERPAFSRIILRLAADRPRAERPTVERFVKPFLALLEQTLKEGERRGILKPLTPDPLQLASTLVGATVFFLAAMPTIAPSEGLDPLSPERFETYRRGALAVARRLVGIPVLFVDREGIIQMWNVGAEATFGYSSDEAIGQSLDLVIPEPYRGRHWEGYRRAMKTGKTVYAARPLCVSGLRKDGRRISLELSVALIGGSDGEVQGVAAIIGDVTEPSERSDPEQEQRQGQGQGREEKAAAGGRR
ncbi:MAG: PAS domain S-box protein [Myxococcota bacterium]